MTNISFGKKVDLSLAKDEGLVLYNSGINNECPGGVFSPSKRVWWVIHNTTETEKYSYTLCQTCYHNNVFGEKDESIKDQLKPVFLQGICCCCDGIKSNEGFPFVFDKFRIGIYSGLPKTQQLFATKDGNTLYVKTNEKKMTYIICVKYIKNQEFIGMKCKMYDKKEKPQNVIFTLLSNTIDVFHMEILGTIESPISNIITPFKFKVTNNSSEIYRSIKLVSKDEQILLEFDIQINYDETFIRPLYPHKVINENGALKVINNETSYDNNETTSGIYAPNENHISIDI